MCRFAAPVFAFQTPVMQNNRKEAETGVTDGDGTLISGRQPVSFRQKPVMSCDLAKIPCYQGRDQFAPDCAHHHPSKNLAVFTVLEAPTVSAPQQTQPAGHVSLRRIAGIGRFGRLRAARAAVVPLA